MQHERTVYPRRRRGNEAFEGEDANALVDTLRDLRSVETVGPEEVEDIAFANHHLARIVGAGAVSPGVPREYDWVEVIPNADGSYREHPISFGGKTGTGAYYQAIEEEGNAAVPVDGTAIVVVRPFPAAHKVIFSYKRRPRWARLTGSSGAAYAGTEIYPSAANTWADLPGGLTFGTAQNPLRELNGITGLPNGTRVLIRQAFGSGAPQVVVNRTQLGDGSLLRETQTVYVKRAVAGTWTMTWDGQTTTALAWNANAAAVEAALEALSNLVNVTVTGSGTEGVPWVIQTQDDFLPHELLEGDGRLLKGDQEWVFSDRGNGSVTVTTLNHHFQEDDVFNTSHAGVTTLQADKATGLDIAVSGTTATFKVLDSNYSGGVYYPGKVATVKQFWKGAKTVGTDDTDLGIGETFIDGGFIGLRGDGFGPHPTSVQAPGGLVICGGGAQAAPDLNQDPDYDMNTAGMSQRTYWGISRPTGQSDPVRGMSAYGAVSTSGFKATSILLKAGGEIILERMTAFVAPPDIYIRWGDGVGAWNSTFTVSGTYAGLTFTSGMLTGGAFTLTQGSTPISGGGAGQLLFDGGGTLGGSNDLTWGSSARTLGIRAGGSQTANQLEVQTSGGTARSGFSAGGYPFTNLTAAPADGDLSAGQTFGPYALTV